MADIRENPAIREAIEREKETRQEAWLGLEEPLCGVLVKPLTLRMVLFLDLARNWYVAGGFASVDFRDGSTVSDWVFNQSQFLWVVSPKFSAGNERARTRFYKSLRKLEPGKLHRAIERYYGAAFFDAPANCSTNSSAPKVDWIAAFVHEFASAYHWPADRILDTPLRVLLQLRRCIQISNEPKSANSLPNPESDAATKDFLDELNRKRTA